MRSPPEDWSDAKFIPIMEKEKTENDINNFRLILFLKLRKHKLVASMVKARIPAISLITASPIGDTDLSCSDQVLLHIFMEKS